MQTARPLPLTTFSQVDYPIELERMFDKYQNQTFTRLTNFTATITYVGTLDFTNGDNIRVSLARQVLGELIVQEYLVTVSTTPSAGTFNISSMLTLPFSNGDIIGCSYYKAVATTPKDVTFGLQPSEGTLAEFKIRANSQGNGKVFIGEILRTYLPEFVAPNDYETDIIDRSVKNIEILFNGQEDNFLTVYYGAKYIPNNFYSTAQGKTPLGSVLKMFNEQLIGYLNIASAEGQVRVFTDDYTIGENTYSSSGQISKFNLYPAIPCRKKIYLSANYGLLPDGELIDVSVPVLAFINRAGQYEYIRFTGSNVNKYNVQEARLKQDYAGTITNADTGLIYEGIELTLADDNENTDFPYLIDKLELQRCKALLMESPRAWLLVNGELQQCLEVRVKRESVRFATSFDKSRDNFTAQCEVIVCQPLGNPQY